MTKVRGFAPATIANVGPGFDVVGLALNEPGDEVEVEFTSKFKGVKLVDIVNNPGLPLGPKNVVEAVGQRLYDSINPKTKERYGVKVVLYKNMKIGTGMGSSASSEAAMAIAMLGLLGHPLEFYLKDVLQAVVYGEEVATGSPHSDNALPSLLGGSLVIYDGNNLNYIRFLGNSSISLVVASPDLRLDTRDMRKVLPDTNKLVELTRSLLKERATLKKPSYNLSAYNLSQIVKGVTEETINRYLEGSLKVMYGLKHNDAVLLGEGVLNDDIITPIRARFIKGYDDVKDAALQEGAYGFSISGSGPSLFAVASSINKAHKIGEAMIKAWERNDVKAVIYVSPINNQGARII